MQYTRFRLVIYMYTISMVALLGSVRQTGASEQWRVSSPGLEFLIDSSEGSIMPSEGGVSITPYGKKTLTGRVTSVLQEGDGTLRFRWEANEIGLVVHHTVIPTSEKLSWTIQVYNRTSEQQRIGVDLRIPIPSRNVGLTYWDGYQQHPVKTGTIFRDKIEYTFPLACVYSNESGIALGIEPHQYLSYLCNRVSADDKGVMLSYGTRLVVAPGMIETVTFILFSFNPLFGYLDAIQTYYGLFPEVFTASEGIDPRVKKSGGYLRSSPATRRLQLEEARRLSIFWEWCYAPYQRNGDWFPDEKDWDPLKGYGTEAHRRATGRYEDYIAKLKERFTSGNRTTAMMFYIIPKYCDATLAITKYPDAIWTFGSGKRFGIIRNDVFKGDESYVVYPYQRELFNDQIEDLRKLAATFDISGFAMDMVNGTAWHYEEAVKKSIGRAFDERRMVYSVPGVAYAKLMDEIHRIQGRTNHKMGVVANIAVSEISYLPVFHADTIMYEAPPYYYRSSQELWALRYLAGHKAITWWKGYFGPYFIGIKLEGLSPLEKTLTLRGLEDYVLLASFRLGGFPLGSQFGIGHPRILQALQLLNKLVEAGWQPVPGAIVQNSDVWVSRYGSVLNSFLVLSNPTRDHIKTKATIFNSYFGKGNYLFGVVSNSPRPLENTVSSGKTHIAINLAPKEILILRPVGTLDDDWKGDKGIIVASGGTIASILRNEQVDVKDDVERLRNWFSSMSIDKPDFVIGVPDEATESLMVSAQMVEGYFGYVAARGLGGILRDLGSYYNNYVPIEIKRESELTSDDKRVVFVGVPSGIAVKPSTGIGRAVIELIDDGEREILLLSGLTQQDVREAVVEFLRLLDQRYPVWGSESLFPEE